MMSYRHEIGDPVRSGYSCQEPAHGLPSIGLDDPSLLRLDCLIGGQWQASSDGATIIVHDPATGLELGYVPSLADAQVELAIASATAAQLHWQETLPKERAAILGRLAALMEQHGHDLARIIVAEQGKPLHEAQAEVSYARGYIEWFGEEAKRTYGDVIPSPWNDRQLLAVKRPVGVFAAITPWNFPLAMIARKVAPGWAAGCAAVIRPDSATPFSALALALLAERAGLPAGVCNVVTGDAVSTGKILCADERVRKLSFTGSTPVGSILLAQCAPTVKKVSMELGGNAPFIVFEDADIDAAVAGAIAAKFRNGGQTCVAVNRFLVHADIYESFAAKLAEAVARLKIGPGLETGVDIGPMIHDRAVQKVEQHIADALGDGARLLVGGRRHDRGGTYFEPTVLADVSPLTTIFREETFGPVAALARFETEAEAVRIANDTPFGLAAYFYSSDISRVFRLSRQIEAGMIGINTGVISTEVAPFGGVKASGMGREGSRHGIEDYQEIQYLCIAS